jgi:hypothetical protein
MAGNSSWDQASRQQKLGLVWRIRKKISQIIKDYFHLPFFLLIILCSSPFRPRHLIPLSFPSSLFQLLRDYSFNLPLSVCCSSLFQPLRLIPLPFSSRFFRLLRDYSFNLPLSVCCSSLFQPRRLLPSSSLVPFLFLFSRPFRD